MKMQTLGEALDSEKTMSQIMMVTCDNKTGDVIESLQKVRFFFFSFHSHMEYPRASLGEYKLIQGCWHKSEESFEIWQ